MSPELTLRATLLGTLRRTAFPPPEGLTRMETCSEWLGLSGGLGLACWLWGELVYGVTPPGVGLIARNTCFVPIFGTFK